MEFKCPYCGTKYNKKKIEKEPQIGFPAGDDLWCYICNKWISEFDFL